MTRTAALRLSILVSMGLVPIACSGKTLPGADEDDGGAGSTGESGGTSSIAGKPSKGGVPPTGTSGAGGASTRGGSTGKAGSGGAAGEGGSGPAGCTNGKLDPVTGLVTCGEGYEARPLAKTCADPNGAGGESAGGGGEGGADSEGTRPRATGTIACSNDADCAAFELGYCSSDDAGGGIGGANSVCVSGRLEDADCGDGYACICSPASGHGGQCVPSNCRTNSDCDTGFVCASYYESCGAKGFACTTAKDECHSCRGDCPFLPRVGHRVCYDTFCGRPFLVEQQARVAPVVRITAWCDQLSPRVDHLTDAERAALAAHWTKLGLMEHASTAAFARFQLQLLALGAPAELVQACNRALIDETAHTRLCFGLASAYAGKSLGPGPLDVSHSLDVTSLADIVDLVIAEGCFGETSAALEALEALEAADAATEPVVRRTYEQIAADEQRHAELAFQFVQWALERDRAAATPRVIAALSHAPAHVRDVAVPCLRALVEQPLAA